MTNPRASKTSSRTSAIDRPNEVAALRHELRTPLSGMLGLLSLLLDSPLTPEQHHLVTSLESASLHLSALVDEVLSPSADIEDMSVTRISFDLHDLVTDIVALYKGHANAKSLDLRIEMDTRCPRLVWGDPIRLRQILGNLMSNAVKFTTAGSVALRVKVAVGDTRIRFEVVDTGSGIDERATRLLRQRSDGSGIGLVISRNIAERLGGRLVFTSRIGRGTTASFSLPLPSAEGANHAPRLDTVQARVLLVEDDPISQTIVEQLLVRLGHVVAIVETGSDAIDRCNHQHFDLVILDGHLPDMPGIDVVRALRAQDLKLQRHLPVVSLTAAATSFDRARSLAAGMDGYLAKPVSMAELASTVERWLARSPESVTTAV